MIVSYSSHSIYRFWRTIPDKYLSPYCTADLVAFYQRNEFQHGGIIDRTRTLKHWLNITPNLPPVPKFKTDFDKTYADISLARAKDYLDTGNRLHVMWSGGLDSTAILAALAYHKPPRGQVTVFGNLNSLVESGDLFDTFIRPIFPDYQLCMGTVSDVVNAYRDGDIVINGLCGNQVTGGLIPLYGLTYDEMMKPYQSFVDEQYLGDWHSVIAAMPRRVETYYDLISMMRLTQNWIQSPVTYKLGMPLPIRKAMSAFYDSEAFQDWAISSKEQRVEPDRGLLKFPQRRFIADALGCHEYAMNKKPTPSMLKFERGWLFYTDDDQIIHEV